MPYDKLTLVRDAQAAIAAGVDDLTAAGVAGSVTVIVHFDTSGPRKVETSTQRSFSLQSPPKK